MGGVTMRNASQRTLVLQTLTDLSESIDHYEKGLKTWQDTAKLFRINQLSDKNAMHRANIHMRLIRILYGRYTRILKTLNEY